MNHVALDDQWLVSVSGFLRFPGGTILDGFGGGFDDPTASETEMRLFRVSNTGFEQIGNLTRLNGRARSVELSNGWLVVSCFYSDSNISRILRYQLSDKGLEPVETGLSYPGNMIKAAFKSGRLAVLSSNNTISLFQQNGDRLEKNLRVLHLPEPFAVHIALDKDKLAVAGGSDMNMNMNMMVFNEGFVNSLRLFELEEAGDVQEKEALSLPEQFVQNLAFNRWMVGHLPPHD